MRKAERIKIVEKALKQVVKAHGNDAYGCHGGIGIALDTFKEMKQKITHKDLDNWEEHIKELKSGD